MVRKRQEMLLIRNEKGYHWNKFEEIQEIRVGIYQQTWTLRSWGSTGLGHLLREQGSSLTLSPYKTLSGFLDTEPYSGQTIHSAEIKSHQ